jgi:hypothetical protein
MPRLKFNQNIYVAIRSESVSQYGAKEGQLADVIAAAKVRNTFPGYVDVRSPAHF